MVIKPKIRGFICLTTHPTGCREHVNQQVNYIQSKGSFENGPKKVLVVGASTGYGLASRIALAFGCKASTIGLFFEREAGEKRPATAGWYNSAAFHSIANENGLYAKSLNGDAFSMEMKTKAIELIKRDLGEIDCLVYSLASPRRKHPKTGEIAKSTLKPIGQTYDGVTLDTDKAEVKPVSLEPANDQEIAETISVMGGEDWEMWIDALNSANVLADGFKTVAYTYIGPKLTWPIYWDGTIGKAKEDLDRAAQVINGILKLKNGNASVAVMKAVVTQSSSAIPTVPLYISLLFKIMKEKGIHEGPIEQAQRLFATQLYGKSLMQVDDANRLRLDDFEMQSEVQAAVDSVWNNIKTENLHELTDYKGYQEDFLKLFGFGFNNVDYDADVNPTVEL